mgnify:CR=1 FL=1|jgi:cyclic lactone autoinducer peptide
MRVLNVLGKNNKTGGCQMKISKKINKKVLKVVERIVRNEAENVMVGDDPPYCFGIYHQPKRPKRKVD